MAGIIFGGLLKETLADFNLAVFNPNRQSAKFNSPPIFPAIRYAIIPVSLFAKSAVLDNVCLKSQSELVPGIVTENSVSLLGRSRVLFLKREDCVVIDVHRVIEYRVMS